MTDTIQDGLHAHFARIRGLVLAHEALARAGPDATIDIADVLRAAVVLLHSALEELLRSLEALTLERPDARALAALKYGWSDMDDRGQVKLSLAELVDRYPGKTVDKIVRQSVDAYLERTNYNHPRDIAQALVRVGLKPKLLLDPVASDLESMMERRHWIAHRLDRHRPRNPAPRPLRRALVVRWIAAVERFARQVLGAFERRSTP